MAAKATKIGVGDEDRRRWLAAVEQLAHQVEAWANDRHWSVHRDQKQVHESRLGDYAVPVLTIARRPDRSISILSHGMSPGATVGLICSRGRR
jgi:hypothetical protein